MKIQKLILLGLIMLGLPAVGMAQFDYITNNGAITITGYTGTNGNAVIPAIITGLPVTAINGFYSDTSLTNITIPASVTNVSSGAFAFQSQLTAILVDILNPYYSSSNGVLFDGGQFTLIEAPSGITGNYMVPGTVTSIAASAFLNCSGLTQLSVPNSVTNIGNGALENCSSLTNITLGTNVAIIGNSAFQNCVQLTGIAIPASVTNIGSAIFNGCNSLAAITVDEQNPAYMSAGGALFNIAQTTLIQVPAGFVGIFALPDGVTNISSGALAGCSQLTAITASGQNAYFTTVNGVLFDKLLTTLVQFPGGVGGSYTIANGITHLSSTAFSGCTNLTSIAIPSSVTNVGNGAFQNCSHAGIFFAGNAPTIISSSGSILVTVQLLPPQPIIGFGIQAYNPSSEAVYYLPGTTGWGSTFDDIVAYLWNPPYVCTPSSNSIAISGFVGSGSAITVPNTIDGLPVTIIADGLFDSAAGPGLTNIILGTNITSIGEYAFAACDNLTSITIPGSVTNIGLGAFTYCNNLTGIYFQGNSPTAGANIFFQWSIIGFPFFGTPYEPPNPTTVYYLPGTTGWSTNFAGQPAVLWNPQAQMGDGSFGMHAGGFGFNVTGSSNIVVVVEASTNLSGGDWQPVQTITLPAGFAYFNDPQWTNYPGRFYRFRSP